MCTCPASNGGWISRAEPTANCAVTASMPWRRLVIDGEHYIYRSNAGKRGRRLPKPDVIQAPEMHFDLLHTLARFLFRFPLSHPLFSPWRWIVDIVLCFFLSRNVFQCVAVSRSTFDRRVNSNFKRDLLRESLGKSWCGAIPCVDFYRIKIIIRPNVSYLWFNCWDYDNTSKITSEMRDPNDIHSADISLLRIFKKISVRFEVT